MTDQKDVPVQCDAAKPVAWQWFWKSRGVWVNLNIEPSEKDLQEMKDNGIECRALYAARLTPAASESVSPEELAIVIGWANTNGIPVSVAILQKFEVRPRASLPSTVRSPE